MSSTPWFLAPPASFGDGVVTLPEAESHHAARVLRVAPPDIIVVTDGRGRVARCSVTVVGDRHVTAEILSSEGRRRPRPEVAVYQGAAKGRKVDDAFERLAEMGIAEAVAFSSQRSVVRWDDSKAKRLAGRWESVAIGAAKQSRNPFVMETGPPLAWPELLERVRREPSAVVLWEGASLPLRTALEGPVERIALIVGPEGGFERSEAEALADAGARLVSLGPTILRTENAAVVAAAAVLYHYGVIG